MEILYYSIPTIFSPSNSSQPFFFLASSYSPNYRNTPCEVFMQQEALGMVETKGLTAAIEAA
ncbi:MAG: hypothetical protein E6294_04690, partial [Klebsiella sp.]|nr:hypothetical protein [Klebsiella sp.]